MSAPQKSNSPVLVNVQILRAVAALLIVLGHSVANINRLSAHVGRSESLSREFPTGFGVDLFFVISGFIILISTFKKDRAKTGRREFVLRRLIRVVPIYWICTTLFIGISLLKGTLGLAGEATTFRNILSSYFFLPYRTELSSLGLAFPIYDLGWTLNYEMFFYALFAVFIALPRSGAIFSLLAILCCLVTYGGFVRTGTPINVWSQPIVLEFGFGVLVGAFYLRGWRLSGPVCGLLLVIALAALLAHPFGKPHSVNGTNLNDFARLLLWGLPAVMVVAAAALGPSLGLNRLNVPLVFMGDASYSIYLFHPYSLLFTTILFSRIVPLPSSAGVSLVITLTSAIFVSCVFYVLIERSVSSWLLERCGFLKPRRALIHESDTHVS